jgi:hypothetical protein
VLLPLSLEILLAALRARLCFHSVPDGGVQASAQVVHLLLRMSVSRAAGNIAADSGGCACREFEAGSCVRLQQLLCCRPVHSNRHCVS